MNAHQAALFVRAQSLMAHIEAMKIANKMREADGKQYAYDEAAFFDTATQLENISIALLNS